MARFVRNLAALVKTETVYGTDAAPTGSANAMQMSNVTLDPMVGEQVSRELLLPYMGHQGVILTGLHGTVQGQVEIAGAGTPGDVPAFGPLLRACGLQQVVTEDTDVQYSPVSTAFEAASFYYILDGVKHVLLGVRGTVSLSLVPKQIPRFQFNLMGLSGTISDVVSMPAVDLTKFIVPVPVNKANTTMSLHGWNAIAESIAVNLAGKVEPRFLIGYEGIEISGRESAGTAVVEATSLATKNWLDIAKAHTKGVLAVQHGTAAGNIVKIDAPKVQIGPVTQGETQGIANYSLPLMFTPDEGNDELVLTIK